MILTIQKPYSEMGAFKLTYLLILIVLLSSCERHKRHLVVSKIQSSAKLATTETAIDKVVIGNKSRRVFGLINVSNAEFVAYSQAFVKTGVDLTKLKKNDIKIDGSAIELRLPPVEVLDFSYPFDSFRIDPNLTSNAMLSKIDVIDQEFFFRKAELDIRENLQYMGIREQTEENTRKIMVALLKNMGYDEIYISFADSGQIIKKVNLKIPDEWPF
ncbi:DUF4230 domain-containing protein [Mangrovibacterium diazotrophicum]|nr:DUF4230 domain-containing protein [Mangrovibacterium diazotrophicum]